MTEDSDRLFVITGGPGAGKTTLIEALAAAGWRTTPESARRIIQDQVRIGGRALHQTDPALAAELSLSWDMRAHGDALAAPGPVFFDRSVVELAGYHRMMGLPRPDHFKRAAERFRYNRRVFLAPPWPEIYATDAERKHSWGEAVRTCQACERTYIEADYELVALPLVSVAERVAFVLDACGLLASDRGVTDLQRGGMDSGLD